MGFQADSLTTGEPLKNNLYQSDYNQLGMAFAPMLLWFAIRLANRGQISSDTSGQQLTPLLNTLFQFPPSLLQPGHLQPLPWFPLLQRLKALHNWVLPTNNCAAQLFLNTIVNSDLQTAQTEIFSQVYSGGFSCYFRRSL